MLLFEGNLIKNFFFAKLIKWSFFSENVEGVMSFAFVTSVGFLSFSNLSFRILVLLIFGFIVLVLLIFSFTNF